VVVDAQNLVHHRLVRPLVEEGCDRVVTAIQDEQQRCDVGVEGKQLMLSTKKKKKKKKKDERDCKNTM